MCVCVCVCVCVFVFLSVEGISRECYFLILAKILPAELHLNKIWGTRIKLSEFSDAGTRLTSVVIKSSGLNSRDEYYTT